MTSLAPAGASGGGDPLRQRMLRALDDFDAVKTSRQVALEVDCATLIAPCALVGRQLRLFWPEDSAWYAGTVASYDPATGKHTIEYTDGDTEAVHIATQRVKIALTVGADVPAADPDELEAHCNVLEKHASKMKAASAEEKEAKERLQAVVPKLRAAAKATRARLAKEEAEKWAALAVQAVVEADQMPDEEEAGDAAPAVPPPPTDAAAAPPDTTDAGETAAVPSGATEAAPPPAKKRKKGAKSSFKSGKSATRPDESARAAAEAWTSTLRPGDVVWSTSYGTFPPWPAMVITREQCWDGTRPKEKAIVSNARFIPLMFFGTYERYFAPPEKLTPLRQGILAGLCVARDTKRQKDSFNFARSVGEIAEYMSYGDVPERMFPNNDGEEDSEEEEEPVKGGKRRGGGKKAGGGGVEGLRWTSITREPNMPMTVGNLKVLALGKVHWLHPGFHDERSIWPVGYRAERHVRTPAGGTQPTRHLCEILEAEDGSGPIFQITPWGGRQYHGRTLNRAWAALFEVGPRKGNGSAQLMKGAQGGARQFGLTATPVLGAILALPGAERCERFAGWPVDAPPRTMPPLTPEELQQRLAYEAAAARLPDGVAGAAAVPTDPGVCAVCMEEEEEDEDLVLQCDRCGLFAHMSCYGVAAAPEGRLWLCDPCQAGAPSPPPACALCPVLGGALKRTDCGRWAHPTCALWIPDGPFLDPGAVHCGGAKGLVRGLGEVPQERRALKCSVCAQPHGACIQCSNPGCYTAFHVMCARQALGYHMRVELVSDDEEEEEEEAATGASGSGSGGGRVSPAGAAQEGGVEGRGCGSPSGDENAPNGAAAEAAAEAAAAGEQPAAAAAPAEQPETAPTDAPGSSTAPATLEIAEKKPSRPRRKRQTKRRRPAAADHAVILNGARLLAFCARHNPLKPSTRAADPMDVDGDCLPGGAGGAAAVEAAAAAAAARGWPVPGYPSPWPCARAIPLDAALRRGPRAPEAMEAALAKRRYVQATPLLVGGPTPLDPGAGSGAGMLAPEERGRCTWHSRPEADAAEEEGAPECAAVKPEPANGGEPAELPLLLMSDSLLDVAGAPAVKKEEPGCAAAAAAAEETVTTAAAVAAVMGRVVDAVEEELEVGDNQSRPSNSLEESNGGGGSRGGGGETPGGQQVSTARGPDPGDGLCGPDTGNVAPDGGEGEDAVVPALAPPPRAAAAEALRSSSERYYEMRATEGARVVPGKSAIHGWGAFARVPHKKHDMVIEYVGDLVCPSVAEFRERSAYDSLVGAGTYVFRLNAQSCVDATRSGNLAHLLNHSCAPNCYSRTVPVWDPILKKSTDHVVIFAARDIEAWEELTYDYRFSGEERLVCNCGAEGCRGMVNKKESGGGDGGVSNGGVLPVGTVVPKSECRWPLAVAAAAGEQGGNGNGKKRQRDA